MALNCKPGDMAMVVRDYGDEEVRQLLGRTMRVLSVHDYEEEVGARWLLEEPIHFKGQVYEMCADIILMPIDRPTNDLPAEDKVVDIETV